MIFFFQPNLCNSIDKNKLRKICKEVNSFSFFFLFLLSLLYLKFIIVFFHYHRIENFSFFFSFAREEIHSILKSTLFRFILFMEIGHIIRWNMISPKKWIVELLKYWNIIPVMILSMVIKGKNIRENIQLFFQQDKIMLYNSTLE